MCDSKQISVKISPFFPDFGINYDDDDERAAQRSVVYGWVKQVRATTGDCDDEVQVCRPERGNIGQRCRLSGAFSLAERCTGVWLRRRRMPDDVRLATNLDADALRRRDISTTTERVQ